ACSSSSTTQKPAPPAPAAQTAAPPPSPAGVVHEQPLAKTNPDVVEETPAYSVQRFKKSDMVRVDEHRIRYPFTTIPMAIYREDADYYYVRTEKVTPEEMNSARAERREKATEGEAQKLAELEAQAKTNPLLVTPEQFDTLLPPRRKTGVAFQRAGEGLPTKGQWRQNIAVADLDGDGHPDIVATPARLSGQQRLHVYLGDGHGAFREQTVQLVDAAGKPTKVTLDYGGVAVADFDGDGRPDIATASHSQSVHVFLNRGGGKYQVSDQGLPPKLTSQAVAAFDVNGDGRPDLAVSQDMVNNTLRKETGTDPYQVRIFLNQGKGKWQADREAIKGPCFSFNLFPVDLSGAGPRDLLTGCRALGGWGLTWKNDGKGKFSNELFEIIEQAAYHYAVAPGTFGSSRHTAFADLYEKNAGGLDSTGLNVYYKDPTGWHKVPVWRQKRYRTRLTSVAMGDLDGDGLDDLVFPDRTAGKVRIFFQMAEGRFEEAPEESEPPLDSPAADTRLVDVNGDGRLDIVMAKTGFSERPKDRGGFEVLLNQGK
ncbi:MAG TPA: VCBS repeat-containing protein, partial [Thermoanaerobaculia bacterium]|nr:VCBS repeat-containing protein [Thermoanaerobaculia bacterium]